MKRVIILFVLFSFFISFVEAQKHTDDHDSSYCKGIFTTATEISISWGNFIKDIIGRWREGPLLPGRNITLDTILD